MGTNNLIAQFYNNRESIRFNWILGQNDSIIRTNNIKVRRYTPDGSVKIYTTEHYDKSGKLEHIVTTEPGSGVSVTKRITYSNGQVSSMVEEYNFEHAKWNVIKDIYMELNISFIGEHVIDITSKFDREIIRYTFDYQNGQLFKVKASNDRETYTELHTIKMNGLLETSEYHNSTKAITRNITREYNTRRELSKYHVKETNAQTKVLREAMYNVSYLYDSIGRISTSSYFEEIRKEKDILSYSYSEKGLINNVTWDTTLNFAFEYEYYPND